MRHALSALLLACAAVSSLVRAAEPPEPPDIPWAGGPIAIGQEKFDVLPPGTMPGIEKLLPKVEPAKNPARYYFAAFNVWTPADESFERGQLNPKDWEAAQPAINEWLKKNEAALAWLDKAAAFPSVQWPLLKKNGGNEADGGLYFSQPMPYLSYARQVAKCRSIIARQSLDQGKIDEALRQLELTLALARQLDDTGSQVGALVGMAIDGIAVRGIAEDIVCSGKATSEHLTRLQKLLQARRESLSTGVNGIKIEQAALEQLIDLVMSNPDRFAQTAAGRTPSLPVNARLLRIVFPDRLMRKQVNDYFNLAVSYAGKHLWQAGDVQGQLEKAVTDMPRWNFAAQMLASEWMILAQFGRRRADFDCAITAVAAAQFRADTKKLPEKLDDLVPKVLAAVPLDEFTGKPLLYKATDGARVYSVGFDKKDDNGARNEGLDQVFFIEDAPARHSEN